jgi:Dyp-type peroxidase family
MLPEINKYDIQGLLIRSYGHLPAACYILLQIQNPEQTKEWLRKIENQITRGDRRDPVFSLNLAFTWGGFDKLRLPEKLLKQFSREFQEGMTVHSRARILGDVSENRAENWLWGGPKTEPVDVLLMLFASSDDELERQVANHRSLWENGGLKQILKLDSTVLATQKAPKEHFGFHDGISQPTIKGLNRVDHTDNLINPGEFILGYCNQYDKLPDSPYLEEPQSIIDFGVNGTYLVFRQLEQDVVGFWQSIKENAQLLYGNSSIENCLLLSAKMVGRWPDGTPISQPHTLGSHPSDPAAIFRFEDARGDRCPLGAHIRRANPRDALDANPDTSLEMSNHHRLLRRGRTYGPAAVESMNPVDILTQLDRIEKHARGLYFIALNASISRQFEFIQHTWLNNTKFAGLYEDEDPIIGNGIFTIQGEPFSRRTCPLPRFVTVRGGAYFFMPGLAAIRYLAT